MGGQADGNGKLPCYMAHCNLIGATGQTLQIVGLEPELAYRGMDFDEFQRHIQNLFSTNTTKPAVKFKPAAYPCADKGVDRTIKVVPSEALDPHIREITQVEVISDTDSSYLLGLITVGAAPRPIYLTIDSSDSKNLLHVLPVRKTGQTELEEDLRRIETYISERYEAKIAKRIAEELLSLTVVAKPTPVTPEYLSSLAANNATRWQTEGWTNNLVETFGKDLCSYTTQSGFWEQENRPEVKALLLMVSLHYNSGWEFWTPRNAGNQAAVKALFMALHVQQWWRTRFRVLYALQFMDSQQVWEELNNPCHANLSGETLKAIRNHVPHKTVAGFIRSVTEAELGDISSKARQVLMEIATLWQDPKAGVDSPL